MQTSNRIKAPRINDDVRVSYIGVLDADWSAGEPQFVNTMILETNEMAPLGYTEVTVWGRKTDHELTAMLRRTENRVPGGLPKVVDYLDNVLLTRYFDLDLFLDVVDLLDAVEPTTT
jgi:hypothetical protein